MTRYEGVKCPICGEKFQKDSDVVVCPLCGAPYHRECYKKAGECKYEKEHANGYKWEMPVDQLPSEKIVICPKCSAPNPKENVTCSKCGAALAFDGNHRGESHEREGGFAFGNENKDISDAEVAAYTGSGSFLLLFKFKALSHGAFTWNWSAFFFKYLYFFYRKMYKTGFILLLAFLTLEIPAAMYSIEFLKANSLTLLGVELSYNAQLFESLSGFMPAINILNIVLSVFCGAMANKMLFKKTVADIRKIRNSMKEGTGEEEYLTALHKAGKTDKLSCAVLIVFYIAGYFYLTSSMLSLIFK